MCILKAYVAHFTVCGHRQGVIEGRGCREAHDRGTMCPQENWQHELSDEIVELETFCHQCTAATTTEDMARAAARAPVHQADRAESVVSSAGPPPTYRTLPDPRAPRAPQPHNPVYGTNSRFPSHSTIASIISTSSEADIYGDGEGDDSDGESDCSECRRLRGGNYSDSSSSSSSSGECDCCPECDMEEQYRRRNVATHDRDDHDDYCDSCEICRRAEERESGSRRRQRRRGLRRWVRRSLGGCR